MYSSMSCGKCIVLWSPSELRYKIVPSPPKMPWHAFVHQILPPTPTPVIIQCAASWVWLHPLSIMHLRFIHVIENITVFIAECYSIVWMDQFIYPFTSYSVFGLFLVYGNYEQTCYKYLWTGCCISFHFFWVNT